MDEAIGSGESFISKEPNPWGDWDLLELEALTSKSGGVGLAEGRGPSGAQRARAFSGTGPHLERE